MFEFTDDYYEPRRPKKRGHGLLYWMLIVVLFPAFVFACIFLFGFASGVIEAFRH